MPQGAAKTGVASKGNVGKQGKLGTGASSVVNQRQKNLPFDVDAVLKNASEMNRNGLTNAGRALQKHANRPGDTLHGIKFSGKTANQDAQKIIKEVLKSPNRIVEELERGGYRVYDSVTKRCFDVSRTGIFNGFRKAPGLDNIIQNK